jgi:hypothetical protein
MTRKTYRTAQGKTVDLGALMLQNESIRAVGNMKVNARGDLVDGWNRPIDRRTQQVQKQYDRQVSNVRDEPVVASSSPVSDSAAAPKTKSAKEPKAAPVTSSEPVESAAAAAPTGLAAAMARARQIRQEPIQTASQIAQNKPGVTRI